MFDNVLEILEIESKYYNENNGTSVDSLNIVINANSAHITIKTTDICSNLIKIISDSDLPESDKNEILKLLNEVKNAPGDKGIFKKVANWFKSKTDGLSPTLSVISDLLNIITQII